MLNSKDDIVLMLISEENYAHARDLEHLSIGINTKDGRPHFPQHGTGSLTLNSSNWIYGAIKELGRYYTKQLAWQISLEQRI